MSIGAAVTMILITGVVWGGFVALLLRAIRREARKRDHERR
ncbi:MAG: MetS family NSS transporter small subunit [Acidobacteria bacterium]|nr:MAG: MetS family NSS transporter small subunit [Acidobacteriota bacterium]